MDIDAETRAQVMLARSLGRIIEFSGLVLCDAPFIAEKINKVHKPVARINSVTIYAREGSRVWADVREPDA